MRHAFHVPGIPQPKGSTRSFRHKSTGRVVTLSDNRERLKPWQDAIAIRARTAGIRLTRGPVEIVLTFLFPRPKRHVGRRGLLLPSAPADHLVKPDLDKLTRAAFDALTGVLWVDDAQAVFVRAVKRYATDGEAPGVQVEVATP